MPKYTERRPETARDYQSEATSMIKPLSKNQCQELYGIVIEKLQRVPQKSIKEQELLAVKQALENRPGLDPYILKKHREGYRSSMAHDAHARDGNTKPNRKKV